MYNPLARTQQPWLVLVHTARLGGDLMTTAVLATASTSVALALCGYLWAAAAGTGFVVAVLAFGWASLRRATSRVGRGSPRRVAAVVVDGKPPEHGELTGTWPAESLEYRDVEGTLARYRPHVEEAARHGAEVIVSRRSADQHPPFRPLQQRGGRLVAVNGALHDLPQPARSCSRRPGTSSFRDSSVHGMVFMLVRV